MSEPLSPGAVLGVLGGGQLGRMFALAARRLGYRVHVFVPDEDSPTPTGAAFATVGATAKTVQSAMSANPTSVGVRARRSVTGFPRFRAVWKRKRVARRATGRAPRTRC